jgi:uncharacterized protein YutE (UPF0331/DUF86 family)
MTDDVFERRTRRFLETLEILERLRRTPWERFSADPEKYGSAERFLQVAVEILDDLGAHLVARFGAGHVERYRDIPDRLLAVGRLSEAQADVWRRVIGFRNVIVHNYLDVDRAIVFAILSDSLDDLRDLHRALVEAQASS